jgi:predicted AAA+ superfamily ATPase
MRAPPLKRLLVAPERSFFLFGPRGVGKSTWLRGTFTDAVVLDLLDSALFLELSREPSRLEAIVGRRPEGAWVVLDEIQKAPMLLDEAHRLMEARGWRFVLCGSSARKLRRGGTNLLAGRAVTRHLDGFCSQEIGDSFDPEAAAEWGTLPLVHLDPRNARDILSAYVNTYIKEEIREEGAVRSLQPFLRFLSIAGQLNGQLVNGQNVAREAAVSRGSVDAYFSILEDTLLGHFLPSYRPQVKVRERGHPKFYWFDPGVARAAAGLLFDPVDRLWMGTALETLIFHELRVYNHTRGRHRPISFYRPPSGAEVDFVIETRKRQAASPPHVVCIEVKAARRWERKWEQPMRSLRGHPEAVRVDRMLGVYTGERAYAFDQLDVLPVRDFLRQLHQGSVF